MKKLTFFIALLVLLVVSVSIVTADNDSFDIISADDASSDGDLDQISASDDLEKVSADTNVKKVSQDTSDNKKVAVKKTDDKLSAEDGIKLKKVWKDNNNASGKRPSSVKVTLKLNGETWGEEPVILDAEHDWETLIEADLGADDKLEVIEENVSGYTSEVTGDEKSGYTITNTLKEDENSTSPDETSEDVSDDTPEKETQVVKKTTTTTKVVKKEPKKVKDKHNTGNPILLGVLAISVAGLAYQLRRKE